MKKLILFFMLLHSTNIWACGFGSSISGGYCRGYLTTASSSPWVVPSDWTGSGATIECVGPGGNGVISNGNVGGGGGQGGGYGKETSAVNIVAGNSLTFQVGSGGTTNATYLEDNTNTVICQGDYGAAGSVNNGGNNSQTNIGATLTETGGIGGSSANTTGSGGSGGGGAGGPNGNGGQGGNGGHVPGNAYNGSGGAASGGAAGSSTSSTPTSSGGNNSNSSGGGSGSSGSFASSGGDGTPQSPYGGAGGGAGYYNQGTNGGNGAIGEEWDSTHGTGGGGGATSGASFTGTSGNGGNYGGAGAGSGYNGNGNYTPGNGASGIIAITYTSSNATILTVQGGGLTVRGGLTVQ